MTVRRLTFMAAAALLGLAVSGLAAPPTAPAPTRGLMAGTGMAVIDPAPALFPLDNGTGDAPMLAIHDSLHARALVVDDGRNRTILVVADVIVLPDAVYDRLVTRIAATYGVAKDHVWLTATHCHTVPWSMDKGYEQTVTDGVMAAIRQASDREEPVRVGRGDGRAFININRDEAAGTGFILGQDPRGPSDKTVRVVGFFRRDGSPLAILANYAVHAVSLHSSKTAPGGDGAMVSADIPGVADTFVDSYYGAGRTMTFWTSGAAGDQNPILMSYYSEPDSSGKVVATDMQAAGFIITQRLGESLGREIIRVTDAMTPRAVTTPVRAGQMILTCPAKTGAKAELPIRLSYLGIGTIDLLGVSGEVVTRTDQHLRAKARGRAPVMLTLTNGYDGYLPDDASYRRGQTFEVGKTSFAPGCTEGKIVAGALKLMGR